MDFLYKMLTEHAIPAMFTTLGVFLLTFFVMLVHYMLRRSFYNKVLPTQEDSIKNRKDQYEKHVSMMKEMYQKSNLPQETIFEFEMRDELERLRHESDIWKMETDAFYIKNYSFKRYMTDLLNERFPEAYWRKK